MAEGNCEACQEENNQEEGIRVRGILMKWRRYSGPALVVGVAALLIESTKEPWQTGLTAAASLWLLMWIWERQNKNGGQ